MKATSTNLFVGARVKVEGERPAFEVIERRGEEFLVAAGVIRLWVKKERLKLLPPKEKPEKRFPEISETESSYTVDLHGLTVALAEVELEKALSDALLRHADHLDVIHGIGTGKLKEFVQRYLARFKQVKRFQIQERNPGTTRAYL